MYDYPLRPGSDENQFPVSQHVMVHFISFTVYFCSSPHSLVENGQRTETPSGDGRILDKPGETLLVSTQEDKEEGRVPGTTGRDPLSFCCKVSVDPQVTVLTHPLLTERGWD